MSKTTISLFLETMEIACWNQHRKNHPEVMFCILLFIFPIFSSVISQAGFHVRQKLGSLHNYSISHTLF